MIDATRSSAPGRNRARETVASIILLRSPSFEGSAGMCIGSFAGISYFRSVLRRLAAIGLVTSAVGLAVGVSSSSAGSSPAGTGPLAEFVACMKAHGAPPLGHHRGGVRIGEISAADRTAWKAAFAACRDLLPKRTAGAHGDKPGHGFTRPTAAQFAAFKACMAGKGFSPSKPGSGQRPDFRDPAVRSAFKAALKACFPLLKPASSG